MSPWPETHLLAYSAVEGWLAADSAIEEPMRIAAWQIAADAPSEAIEVAQSVLSRTGLDDAQRVACGHLMTVAGSDDAMRVYLDAWRSTRDVAGIDRLRLGVAMASSSLAFSADKAAKVLGQIAPDRSVASDHELAVCELLVATVNLKRDRSVAEYAIEEAYSRFGLLDDAFGLAQCALVAYARESFLSNRVDVMRTYLEHAIFRYVSCGRDDWAARLIVHALIPLVVDRQHANDDEIGSLFSRAASLAARGPRLAEAQIVFHVATRLGFVARVSELDPDHPPQFNRSR